MLVITDIEAACGAKVRDVDNWLARLDLRTGYEPTVRGRKRRFTIQNVRELAFLSALTQLGVGPVSAVAYSDAIRRQLSVGEPKRFLVFAHKDVAKAMATDTLDREGWQSHFPEAAAFSVLDVAVLTARVERYFTDHGVEAS